ncbi:MAG: radical SAM protein [Peptococcaceae bacterium]|nr:radical SAM protein [Peptococcaceae bacterium]
MKDQVLSYKIDDRLYINITNRCTCDCVFCIRNTEKGVGYDLWLEREPSGKEIIAALGDLRNYREIIFCGYGEPLIRLDIVKEVAAYIKENTKIPVRINTNGHSDLINGSDSISSLKGLVDRISISLNADNRESYQKLCNSIYGLDSFDEVIKFTKSCQGIIPEITLSVVDWPGIDIEKCRKLAEDLGVDFRIRKLAP